MADYSNKKEGKNMMFLLMIIVVLLLVVAIAVIVYLSSRMMSMEKTTKAQPTAQATRTLAPSKPKAPPAKPKPKPQPKPAPQPKERQAKLATEDIATIVQLVMTQMQQSQKTAAPPKPKAVPKRLAEPEPAREMETLQPAMDEVTPEKTAPSSSEDLSGTLENVINVLESADVDTVEEKQPDLSPETAQSMTKTQASRSTPKRAKDNFNKVVVSDSAADEFAELGSEIDQLVQAESKTPKEKRYEQVIQKEVAERTNEMRTIVVSEGDTLISIAKKAYGDGSKYTKILYANPGIIKNPDRIFVGQVLRVPK